MQFIQYKSQPLWRQYYLQQCRVYYITVNIIVSTDSLTGLDMGESNSQRVGGWGTMTRYSNLLSNTPYLALQTLHYITWVSHSSGREGRRMLMELSEFPLNRVKTDTILEETFSWQMKGFLSLF